MSQTPPPASQDSRQEYEAVLARVWKLVAERASTSSHHEVRNNAEDLAQEVQLLLRREYAVVQDWENLKPLALECLWRLSWNHMEKDRRHGGPGNVSTSEKPDVLVDSRLNPEEAAIDQEGRRRLRREIAKLGHPCATLLRLRIVEKLTPREMFPHLHYRTINALYTALSNCVASLNNALGLS